MRYILFIIICIISIRASAQLKTKAITVTVDSLSFNDKKIKHSIQQKLITNTKQFNHSYQAPEKLPLFCELEYQTSKLIKRKVKFGVEPK